MRQESIPARTVVSQPGSPGVDFACERAAFQRASKHISQQWLAASLRAKAPGVSPGLRVRFWERSNGVCGELRPCRGASGTPTDNCRTLIILCLLFCACALSLFLSLSPFVICVIKFLQAYKVGHLELCNSFCQEAGKALLPCGEKNTDSSQPLRNYRNTAFVFGRHLHSNELQQIILLLTVKYSAFIQSKVSRLFKTQEIICPF